MASITLSGDAINSVDATWPHWKLVANYARRSFWMFLVEEQEYWVQEAIDHLIRVAHKLWKPGEGCRISLPLLVKYVKRKARLRGAHRRRTFPVKNLPDTKRREEREQLDTVVDVRLALDKMPERDRRILMLLLAEVEWQEVAFQCGTSVWTISKVRDELRARLADYRPNGTPKKRGRGRPKRDG